MITLLEKLKSLKRFEINTEYNGEFVEFEEIEDNNGDYIKWEDIEKLFKERENK